jgi:hypothetical protein
MASHWHRAPSKKINGFTCHSAPYAPSHSPYDRERGEVYRRSRTAVTPARELRDPTRVYTGGWSFAKTADRTRPTVHHDFAIAGISRFPSASPPPDLDVMHDYPPSIRCKRTSQSQTPIFPLRLSPLHRSAHPCSGYRRLVFSSQNTASALNHNDPERSRVLWIR